MTQEEKVARKIVRHRFRYDFAGHTKQQVLEKWGVAVKVLEDGEVELSTFGDDYLLAEKRLDRQGARLTRIAGEHGCRLVELARPVSRFRRRSTETRLTIRYALVLSAGAQQASEPVEAKAEKKKGAVGMSSAIQNEEGFPDELLDAKLRARIIDAKPRLAGRVEIRGGNLCGQPVWAEWADNALTQRVEPFLVLVVDEEQRLLAYTASAVDIADLTGDWETVEPTPTMLEWATALTMYWSNTVPVPGMGVRFRTRCPEEFLLARVAELRAAMLENGELPAGAAATLARVRREWQTLPIIE